MSDTSETVTFTPEPHPFGGANQNTIWRYLAHFASAAEMNERVVLAPSPAAPDDEALAERLMHAFHTMIRYQDGTLDISDVPLTGIWEMTKHQFQGEFYRLMAEQDIPGLAAYMRNAMRETITHGLGPGRQVFDGMAAGDGGLAANILILRDRMASLAEALGVLPYENPEQGQYGENIGLDAATLTARIEARLGYRIGRPLVMGAYGLAAGDQVIDTRVPDDAYCADRLQTLMTVFGHRHVAEIGGGLGGCALQAIRAGIPSYAIYDLPVVLIVQAWLLAKTLGPGAIALFGETAPAARIHLRPYWQFQDRSIELNLVFNRDSLPEIPHAHAAAYIAEIAARGCSLLSINQESQGHTGQPGVQQLWVNRMVAEHGGLSCVSRHPYWTRAGYLEELFMPRKPA